MYSYYHGRRDGKEGILISEPGMVASIYDGKALYKTKEPYGSTRCGYQSSRCYVTELVTQITIIPTSVYNFAATVSAWAYRERYLPSCLCAASSHSSGTSRKVSTNEGRRTQLTCTSTFESEQTLRRILIHLLAASSFLVAIFRPKMSSVKRRNKKKIESRKAKHLARQQWSNTQT